MNGTSTTNFEGHLCEIKWRNRTTINQENRYYAFFSSPGLLKEVYHLQSAPYDLKDLDKTPLFDWDWNPGEFETTKVMNESDCK